MKLVPIDSCTSCPNHYIHQLPEHLANGPGHAFARNWWTMTTLSHFCHYSDVPLGRAASGRQNQGHIEPPTWCPLLDTEDIECEGRTT